MKRNTIFVTIAFDDGTVETRSLYKWAQEYQIGIRTIYERYYAGARDISLIAPKKGDTLSEDDVHRLWGGKWIYSKGGQIRGVKRCNSTT